VSEGIQHDTLSKLVSYALHREQPSDSFGFRFAGRSADHRTSLTNDSRYYPDPLIVAPNILALNN
jgi:hypothetical protein